MRKRGETVFLVRTIFCKGRASCGLRRVGGEIETAFVLGEFYRRQGAWKFRAVGQGCSSGLAGLATGFGITVDEPRTAPTVASAPTPASAPVYLTKVTLAKEAPAVSLAKQGGTSGAMRINLNWRSASSSRGGEASWAGPWPWTRTWTSTCARCAN
jgi:hypothetical protein